jgi:hypothetical protein
MTHRKHFAEKKLNYAVQLLAGSGDLDARISAAASILIHIEDADVPSSLTADLARLKGLLFEMSSSSNVVFTARGLTNEASRNAAARVVDLYTALVRL